jgi:hypothetical protein
LTSRCTPFEPRDLDQPNLEKANHECNTNQTRRRHWRRVASNFRTGQGQAVRPAGGERHQHQHGQRRHGNRQGAQFSGDHPVLQRWRAVLCRQGPRQCRQRACIAGGISGAQHIHLLAELYGATVILHTDHAAKKLLPWIDGLLDAGEKYFKTHGKPLYSSHMLDLSEEPIEENIEICKRYLERMSKMGMTLEIELGVTGGEEDGVDNSGVDSSKLYTQPEDVALAYERCPRSATGSPSPPPSATCMASTSRATSSCSRSS